MDKRSSKTWPRTILRRAGLSQTFPSAEKTAKRVTYVQVHINLRCYSHRGSETPLSLMLLFDKGLGQRERNFQSNFFPLSFIQEFQSSTLLLW